MSNMLDGNPYEDGMYRGPCMGCKHMNPPKDLTGPRTCAAFPNAIPLDIFHGRVDHDVPRPELGQRNEVVFERFDH